VESSATTTATPASNLSMPPTAGTSSLTSTSVSSGAASTGFGAIGTFLMTGAATVADAGTAPFGKATVADGGTARGTVALGIGVGDTAALAGAAPDWSFTVALGSAGEVAAIEGSTSPSSAAIEAIGVAGFV
jgi:hypothetical protein